MSNISAFSAFIGVLSLSKTSCIMCEAQVLLLLEAGMGGARGTGEGWKGSKGSTGGGWKASREGGRKHVANVGI